jgi:hypothetical protein
MSDFEWKVTHTAALNRFSCPTAQLSKVLGLKPTFAIAKGEEFKPPKSPRLARVSVWYRDTKEWKGTTDDVNRGKHHKALERLVEAVVARRRSLTPLMKHGEIYFKTVVFTNSPNVICWIPVELARAIASLGAVWYCSVWSPKRLSAVLSTDIEVPARKRRTTGAKKR